MELRGFEPVSIILLARHPSEGSDRLPLGRPPGYTALATSRWITPVPTHSLEGLIKWLRHDEWRAPFEDTLAEHLEPACEKASITPDEIASVLGEDIVLMLWGCAFEDFLTRHLEDGRNIVEDYLKRRGWKESASNRAYMAALRSSLMSLYEVSEIVPGQSFRARDLIRGGDPVRVSERTATRSLKPWDRIGARIVKVGPDFILGGGVLPFHFDSSEQRRECRGTGTGRRRAPPCRTCIHHRLDGRCPGASAPPNPSGAAQRGWRSDPFLHRSLALRSLSTEPDD